MAENNNTQLFCCQNLIKNSFSESDPGQKSLILLLTSIKPT